MPSPPAETWLLGSVEAGRDDPNPPSVSHGGPFPRIADRVPHTHIVRFSYTCVTSSYYRWGTVPPSQVLLGRLPWLGRREGGAHGT